ncbi:MAG TPA: hypothetical protein VHX64_09850 [Caulobacteraceae bacterium]|jgi:hypothetical protein|nr:hypothetical protein [Caulobacteraceae bacterium]
MTGAYDEIVGLGYDCRLAFNLRRTFGNPRAFPFDWWVTPMPAVAAFLNEPSVEALYDPRWLEPDIRRGILYAIRNSRYDIELHHEFPRGADGAVVADWPQHLGQAQARTDYLLRRMLEPAPGARILFVRYIKGQERREIGARFQPLVLEIMGALRALYPHAQPELLLIDPPEGVKAEGIASLWINDRNKSDWQGTPELWTERLRGAGISWSGTAAGTLIEADPLLDQAAAPLATDAPSAVK